jgi:hypothetical protein
MCHPYPLSTISHKIRVDYGLKMNLARLRKAAELTAKGYDPSTAAFTLASLIQRGEV